MMKSTSYDEKRMWRISWVRGVATQMERAPREILGKYAIWRTLIELEGPKGVHRVWEPYVGHTLWEGTLYVPLGYGWTLRYVIRPEIDEVVVLAFESGYERFLEANG
jgi:hypothetical protein